MAGIANPQAPVAISRSISALGRQRRIALICFVAVLMATDAFAISFVVDTTLDAVDTAPGDGVCASLGGSCTLRAALQEANALPGEHVVTLPAGTYVLSIAGLNEDGAASGDLDINGTVTINGQSASSTTIDGSGLDRVFHLAGSAALSLTHLTLQNGNASTSGIGGGIYSRGRVTLRHVVVRNCVSSGVVVVSPGYAVISDSSLDANVGHALFVLGTSATLARVSITGNSERGIGVDGTGIPATVSATDTNIAQNTGGGVELYRASAVLTRVTISDNAAGSGAGILVEGNSYLEPAFVTLVDSTVSGNRSRSRGGGLYLLGQDGPVTATIVGSTISNNAAVEGGGIWASSATVAAANATLSGNAALSAAGGAIFFSWQGFGRGLSLVHTTVTSNVSAVPAAVVMQHGTVAATNTIVANNGGAANCQFNSSVAGGGHNLEFPGASCGFSAPGDLHADPLLRLLADNGGPTRTHGLKPGSPALDAGDDAACAAEPVARADQRGARRAGSRCDIGAYEVTTASFTDDPVVVGATVIRAAHVYELRASITDARVRSGLGEPEWTDPVLTGRLVSRIHIEELRMALVAAYDAAQRTRPTFTDTVLAAGVMPVRAVHVTELRAAVRALTGDE